MRRSAVVLLWYLPVLGLSVVIGGAGHGLMFPLAMTCAPFPIGFEPSLGLLALPLSYLFWCVAAQSAPKWSSWIMPALLTLQYGASGLACAKLLSDKSGDYRNSFRMLHDFALPLGAWALLFVGGQAGLWLAWRQRFRGSAGRGDGRGQA